MTQGADSINPPPVLATPDSGGAAADANLQIFARSLAHDFNNLLTGIMGHAALIESIVEEGGDADVAESAAMIRKTAERAAALSEQLMNLARHGAPRALAVDAHDTIREVAGLVTPSLGGRIRIILELAAERCQVTGDPGQLHQALLNLALNARDAMPLGGSLTFATGANEDRLWIEVSDTGAGIPIELHERIFEPLFTTKNEGNGTGLGLAVVKRVVEQHCGSIELHSAPGFGATFRLRLPLRQQQAPALVPEADHFEALTAIAGG